MNIKKRGLVLDLGSGEKPDSRADVLCDRFVLDNRQRAGGFAIVIDRPLVVGDAYRLPFKDKAFDYVICSHLLEHLANPTVLIKELRRVAKAGYLETPSALGERLFGWDFHLWYVSVKNGTLWLRKKKEGVRFAGFFHRLIEKKIWFRRFFEENRNQFYVAYEWEETIKLKVDRRPVSVANLHRLDRQVWNLMKKIDWSAGKDITFYFNWLKGRAQRKLRKLIRMAVWWWKSRFQKKAVVDFLLPLLACPNCRASVELDQRREFLLCRDCQKKYPLRGVIPKML